MQVAVYVMPGHRRSQMCGTAMAAGINRTGDRATIISDRDYRSPEHDACVFYGFIPSLQKIMADYKARGRPAVYIDLGYWKREGQSGYHKVVVNDRHPTAYFQQRAHDDKRAKALGVTLSPWRIGGRSILIASMGYKAAVIAEHMEFLSFERAALAELNKYTTRPILYRPKPSCTASAFHNLPGTTWCKDDDLAAKLRSCHAVVTHHSNVAVDALVAGIPAFCWHGVAALLSLQDLSLIEKPHYPGDRAQWVNDIAFTQWSIPEMAQGLPWRHLKDEGLLA